MRIVVALDSFGGWQSAPQLCARVCEALSDLPVQAVAHPMADGGEGTLAALAAHDRVDLAVEQVTGPLGDSIEARWGVLGDGRSLVEVAEVIGPPRGLRQPAPMLLGTAGVGELIARLAERRRQGIVVGLGGTATVDGGLGLCQALGLAPLDALGRSIPYPAVAAHLPLVDRLVGAPPLPGRNVEVLADVRTTLASCAARFGPQKGLRQSQVPLVSGALQCWADVLDRWRDDVGLPGMDRELVGGGAGGGLGYALAAVLQSNLAPGAPTVARLTRLEQRLRGADVVVVGEGRIDSGSFEGKVVGEVIRQARAAGARVVALAGTVRDLPPSPEGPDAVLLAGDGGDREASFGRLMQALREWLVDLAATQ